MTYLVNELNINYANTHGSVHPNIEPTRVQLVILEPYHISVARE